MGEAAVFYSLPFTFCADIGISRKLFADLAEKGMRKAPILNGWSLGYSHSKQFSIYSLLDKILFRSFFLLLLYNVAEKVVNQVENVANQICKALYSPKPHGNQQSAPISWEVNKSACSEKIVGML